MCYNQHVQTFIVCTLKKLYKNIMDLNISLAVVRKNKWKQTYRVYNMKQF